MEPTVRSTRSLKCCRGLLEERQRLPTFTTSGASLCRTGMTCGCCRRAERRYASGGRARTLKASGLSGQIRSTSANRSGVGVKVDEWRGNRPGRVPPACGRRAKKPAKGRLCDRGDHPGTASSLTVMATQMLQHGREIALPTAPLSKPFEKAVCSTGPRNSRLRFLLGRHAPLVDDPDRGGAGRALRASTRSAPRPRSRPPRRSSTG
jgi:hypothetical protein